MPTLKGMREAGENVAAAGMYLVFAATHVLAFSAAQRPSLLLVVMIETLVAVLFLLRTPAAQASASPYDWITSLGGTLAPLLLRPADGGADVLAGQLVQCAGGALVVLSLASLNRSFGLLPAVRTLRFSGAYRWVRHPIYLGYTVQNAGYLVSNATARNACIVLVALALQVLRILNEERVLASVPEYERYMHRTRWRLLPLVF